jgi:hypothetical protein
MCRRTGLHARPPARANTSDLLAGNGGGSVYAALLALGHTAEEIVELNRVLWTHEVTHQPNCTAILKLLLPFCASQANTSISVTTA